MPDHGPGTVRRFSFDAVIFDMDGVVTRTAELHAAAWKELFDAYLEERARRGQPAGPPFDARNDYLAYVDGKPRMEGARSFLVARGVTLEQGQESDGPERETIHGLAKRKDALFERRLRSEGAKAYSSTLELIERLRAAGIRTGLVTSSRHGREVLTSAGVLDAFDVIVDGTDAQALRLKGKPDPDMFLAATQLMGIDAARSVVLEDAVSGVEAGRDGGFGLVVGVDRGGNRAALLSAGADLVVSDVAELGLDLLDVRVLERRASRSRRAEELLCDQAWHIEQEGFDPAREHEMESIFTLGNGYLGVRGALDTPLPGSHADLFVAGIYDRKHESLPYSEHEFMTDERGDYRYSELVPLPFPFELRAHVDGTPLDLTSGPWGGHRRRLDMARGTLFSEYLFVDDRGRRTLLETWRCASLADPHLLLHEIHVTCQNFDGQLELDVTPRDPERADYPHLDRAEVPAPEGLCTRLYRTSASGFEVALAFRALLNAEPEDGCSWRVAAPAGKTLRLRRYIAIYTNRDLDDPLRAAVERVSRASWSDYGTEWTKHEQAWQRVWEACDVRVTGSPATTQALRFGAYHLTIAANEDPRVSVGARTLSGRAYEGHVFWDVEIFMLPFYLHVAPGVARSLLAYRHHTLPGARARAEQLGYRGACYAWESTVTGADATPREIVLKTSGKAIPIYTGFEQVHVTADVAYAVCRYFDATGDEDFLAEMGAEILLETARFWASRCVEGETHYHIRGVTGPDEYHHTVDDNAYTNWMARLNLEKACWVAHWLETRRPERWQALSTTLRLEPGELETWAEIARDLLCAEPGPDGVIEQFAGFFELAEYRLPEAERFRPPLRRLFEAEQVNASQLIKQADVLMLPFLFPDRFSPEIVAANYDYYEPRTDHGSSLSPAVHAALAIRLGRQREALAYFRRGLWLDLSNSMGNSALGIHAACIAGTWQALVFGFLGLRFSDNGPKVDGNASGRVPADWRSVELTLIHRGQKYPIRVAVSEPPP